MPSPATLVLSRVVRPRRLDAFHAWADEVDRVAAAAPGHDGSVRLEQADGFHHLLHRFTSEDDLTLWQASPEYQALMARADRHSVGRSQAKAGHQVGFALPSEASAHRWKSWLVTLVTVLPVLLAISTGVRMLVPDWPPIAQIALSSPILTAMLSMVILPRVNRLSRSWQVEDAEGRVGNKPDEG